MGYGTYVRCMKKFGRMKTKLMFSFILLLGVYELYDHGGCWGVPVSDTISARQRREYLDHFNILFADDSLTPNADEARRIVDEFIRKMNMHQVTGVEKEGSNSSPPQKAQCGYSQCNLGKPGMLNVHLVAHTHDDVGWLSTVDQYFYGVYPAAGVQYILDTATQELLNDPQKRFIYVEQAFFTRWWNQIHDATRHLIKGLVNAGRLEFILGGWCMNDEASTHYSAIIDQHTIGFRFLYHNFGECGRPRIGWQIDPFGHSREQASIFAQFGFDGLFFARIDYQDYDQRKKTKNLEHVWMGSESLGDQATLFTGVIFDTTYSPPGGFCFECGDDPMMDDPNLEGYNVDKRVDEFLKRVNKQADAYSSNHILITMGSDFQYSNARVNFKNIDKLITYINARQVNGSKVNAFYSTPSCYLYALNQLNLTYGRKDDDYFPYAHRPHAFWTGYFTSRAALKGYERSSNNFLQVCKQLETLANLGPEHGSGLKVDKLRQAMGVVQHHDGVSGTSKQHVAYDYAKMLAKGVSACEEVVNMSYGKLLPLSSSSPALSIQFCPLANVSNCSVSEQNKQFVVLIYNPIAHEVDYTARVPVSGSAYTVKDAKLNSVTAQVVPLPVFTKSIPEFKGSKAKGELVFRTKLPALGLTTFFVTASSDRSKTLSTVRAISGSDVTIKNEYLSLTFSGETGLLTTLTNLEKSLSTGLSNSLLYYKSMAGNNSGGENQASGAYIFRPNGTSPIPISTKATSSVVQGSEVQEVRQIFSDWASQVVRLMKGNRHVEVEWTVGPIPVGDGIGKEVISSFTSNLNTNKIFYTDANGRELLKRVRDYRPTWNISQTEPVAGNYYPVNSRIFIRDTSKNAQLTVLTDRSQGGASISDGQIELMVHRRLLYDDALGVSEPLDEPGLDGKGLIVRGKYYILLDTIENSARLHRDLAQSVYLSPSVSFTTPMLTPEAYAKAYRTEWSGLKGILPDNVHLLTLEQWHSGKFLLRLEHYYQKNDDKERSQVAEVKLKDLFAPFTVVSVEEQTLGANQPLAKATRLQWNVENYGRTKSDMSSFVKPVDPKELIVELKPMQIRTFHVTVNE